MSDVSVSIDPNLEYGEPYESLTWKREYFKTNDCDYNFADELSPTLKQNINPNQLNIVNDKNTNKNKNNNTENDNVEKPTVFRFYKMENIFANPNRNPSGLSGHSIANCGSERYVTLGGFETAQYRQTLTMYSIPKNDIRRSKKIFTNKNLQNQNTNEDPKYRFSHSSCYIAPLNAILLFGGFDHGYNYDDSRLLFLDTMIWYSLFFLETQPHWCALHTLETNLILTKSNNIKDKDSLRSKLDKKDFFKSNDKKNRLLRDKLDVYLFGGQYHDGGPYSFLNDLWRYTFYDSLNDENKINNNGFWECVKMDCKIKNENDMPCQRSQHYSWIKDNKLFIYGGVSGDHHNGQTLNDLYYLDLNNYYWNKLNYDGIIPAPPNVSFVVTPGKVFSGRPNAYFDSKYNKLIIIHFGSDLDFKKMIEKEKDNDNYDSNILDISKNNSKDKIEIKKNETDFENDMTEEIKLYPKYGFNGCAVYVLDLNTYKWKFIEYAKDSGLRPPVLKSSRLVRIGDSLIFIGGKRGSNRGATSKDIWLLKIPTPFVSWEYERLVWIGYLKETANNENENESKNKNDDDKCHFVKLPKDVIRHICKFLSHTQYVPKEIANK